MSRTGALVTLAACVLLAAGCEEEGVRPMTTVSAADTADQVLAGFEHFVTSNGVRKVRVQADSAYMYDASQTTLLRDVRAVFYGSDGREVSTLTAAELLYQWQTGSMEAEGDVRVVATDGRRLRSDKLVYDSSQEIISTDRAFTFEAPGQYLTGQGFRTDPSFQNIVTQQPRGRPGSELLLPGQ